MYLNEYCDSGKIRNGTTYAMFMRQSQEKRKGYFGSNYIKDQWIYDLEHVKLDILWLRGLGGLGFSGHL